MKKKTFFNWVKFIIIIYCIIGIAIYYLQDKLIFHPAKLAADYKYQLPVKYDEIYIPINKTDTVHILKLIPDGKATGAVLYFHGNSGNNSLYYNNTVKLFLKNNLEVWIPDYPGFGKTTGNISEDKIKEQAIQVERLASSAFAPHKVIFYGQSLGTGVASYLASETACRFLILETPYADIPSLFDRYAFMYPTKSIVQYKFPTIDYLKNITEPIIIFHGTNDKTIPLKEALKLKSVLKPMDKFYILEGSDHNNINQSPQFLNAVDSLLHSS